MMIHIMVLDQNLVIMPILSSQTNLDGFVHVQIMRATTPSASTYKQLNSIVVKVKFLNMLNQGVGRTTISPIANDKLAED